MNMPEWHPEMMKHIYFRPGEKSKKEKSDFYAYHFENGEMRKKMDSFPNVRNYVERKKLRFAKRINKTC